MAPDALLMLARQLRRGPNPDAIEDAAADLEVLAIDSGWPDTPYSPSEGIGEKPCKTNRH